MSTPSVSGYYADFSGLESLKKSARQDETGAVHAAAKQFESLFTNMLLKTMREANLGEGMGDSDSTQFYQSMFDQQLSVQLSQGKGLGLADMLVQQLTRTGLVKSSASPQGAASAASTGSRAGGDVTMPVPATSFPATTSTSGVPTAFEFVQKIAPGAQSVAQQLGVPTEAIIAQAALETGWGQHMPTDSAGNASNNLFGIKAGSSWSGASVTGTTTEFDAQGASRVQQPFRAYASADDSLGDYAQLLQTSPRYAAALNSGDVHTFATALQKAGYATDPQYAQKLTQVANSVRALLQGVDLKSDGEMPTTSQTGSV